jgi:hypothetical protein
MKYSFLDYFKFSDEGLMNLLDFCILFFLDAFYSVEDVLEGDGDDLLLGW